MPKRARRSGWRGRWRIGSVRSSLRASKPAAGRAKSRCQAAPSRPRPAAVSSMERSSAAVQPMAVTSPAYRQLGLADRGLEWLWPEVDLAPAAVADLAGDRLPNRVERAYR